MLKTQSERADQNHSLLGERTFFLGLLKMKDVNLQMTLSQSLMNQHQLKCPEGPFSGNYIVSLGINGGWYVKRWEYVKQIERNDSSMLGARYIGVLTVIGNMS